MKHLMLLTMSLFSILFGCNTKKTPAKAEEWPRFPATDKSEIRATAIPLADDFWLRAFYISSDQQNIYVLGSRAPQESDVQGEGKYRSVEPEYMDYRLLCLDARGQTKYHKDLLRTDWMDGGSLGLLQGELLLRIGDWFLVLEPTTFGIKEKIKVHNPRYISWKETVMTADEHRADYQAKFDAALNNCKTCKWLHWPPTGAYMVLAPGAPGKRSAWLPPMFYEADQLAEMKHRFEPLSATINPKAVNNDTAKVEITDALAHIREVERLSAGTQLVYPNYKSRSVLQYELTANGNNVRFSTSDRDGHALHLDFSDNLMLSMADGSVWLAYEDVLYRIH